VNPGKEILQAVLGKAFGLVETLQRQAPEHFHDSGGIQRRQEQKPPSGVKTPLETRAWGLSISRLTRYMVVLGMLALKSCPIWDRLTLALSVQR
jgi:hypothetical protein